MPLVCGAGGEAGEVVRVAGCLPFAVDRRNGGSGGDGGSVVDGNVIDIKIILI